MSQDSRDIETWIGKQQPTDLPIHLSVVVPAYNERWRLPPTIIDIIDYFDSVPYTYEVIIVDDGSRDETADVVRKFEKVRQQVRLISLPKNYGKGHAVRLGVLNAKGARVLFADADGATPIAELSRLMKALDEGADIAIGSRALASSETRVTTRWYRKYLGRMFNFCVNWIVLPGIADTQCGFKLFTAKAAEFVFRRQQSDGFSFDVEILFIAIKAGLKIVEVPVNWTNVAGSKVNLVLDAARMFRDVFRFKVRHRGVTPDMFVGAIT